MTGQDVNLWKNFKINGQEENIREKNCKFVIGNCNAMYNDAAVVFRCECNSNTYYNES